MYSFQGDMQFAQNNMLRLASAYSVFGLGQGLTTEPTAVTHAKFN